MNRLFLLAALAGIAALRTPAIYAEDLPAADSLLAKIPAEAGATFQPCVSPSGRMCALVRTAEKKSSVIVDGKEGERFDGVCILQFNPTARTVTYLAQEGRKLLVVRGQTKGEAFDSIPYLRCAPDGDMSGWNYSGGGRRIPAKAGDAELASPRHVYEGEHLAYWGINNDAWTFVFDDKKWSGFARSDHSEADGGANFCFSPDGAFVAFEGRTPDWKWEVFGNTFKSGKVSSDWLIGVATDGQPIYYAYDLNAYTLCVGPRKIGAYAQMGGVAATPDGARLVYCAFTEQNGKSFLYDTGKQVAPFYTSESMVLSPDKKSYACFAQGDGKTRLVLNGTFAPVSYPYCFNPPIFSPDSAHVAYAAQKENKKWVVVCDGVESAEFDFVGNITFGPDGKTLGFTASSYADVNKDQNFIVVGNKPGAHFNSVQGLAFSPDGQHHAYLATTQGPAGANTYAAILDEVPGPVCESIDLPLTFTRDGVLLYKANRDGESVVIVGSQTLPLKDPPLTPLIFNAVRTQAGYVVQSGNEIWWRTLRVAPGNDAKP
jgi:hypothetical protein